MFLNADAVRVVAVKVSTALAVSIAAHLGVGQHFSSRSRLRSDVDRFGRKLFRVDVFVADPISISKDKT